MLGYRAFPSLAPTYLSSRVMPYSYFEFFFFYDNTCLNYLSYMWWATCTLFKRKATSNVSKPLFY